MMSEKPQVTISKMPDGRYQVVLDYGNNVKTIWVAATIREMLYSVERLFL
jgi:hypothetical protein